MKKYLSRIILSLVLLLLLPISSVFGASFSIESSSEDLHVGDVVVLKVFLDTEKLNINTFDGEISINDASNSFLIKEINTANSKFTLWPRTPSLSQDRKTISFTGGVPGGIKSAKALVLNIVVEAIRPGKVILSEKDVYVLLHDGKGTSIEPTFISKTLNVIRGDKNTILKDEWSGVVTEDTTPPNRFDINIGNDPNLFDGNRFISFNTTDEQSGIDYYLVAEGNLPPVRSGSTYVLQNQDSNDNIIVSAFDKAGNVTVSKYDPNSKDYKKATLIVLTFVLVMLVLSWFLNKRKIKNDIQ